MRNIFPGYYQPSSDEFDFLWNEALFVLDANILLNLYRYSKETREELFSLLSRLKSRLWLPHQAALEYHKNRLIVICSLEDAYEKITGTITDFENKLLNTLNGFSRHPLIEVTSITGKLNKTFSEVKKELADTRINHPDLNNEDLVRDQVTSLFEGKVGPAYSDEQLRKIYAEGKIRYEKQIPPGYKDEHKDDETKFGDLVVWKQIIDKAKESNKPILFITDDRKDDWWERVKGRAIRPRPELTQEIWTEAGVKFYMYQTDPFMEHAAKHLKRKVKKNAIDEIKGVRKYYEDLKSTSDFPLSDMLLLNKKYEDILKPMNLDSSIKELALKSMANDEWRNLISHQILSDKIASNEEILRILQKNTEFKKNIKKGLLDFYIDDDKDASKRDDE